MLPHDFTDFILKSEHNPDLSSSGQPRGSTKFLHGSDIVPIPPPHGSPTPGLAECMRISGSSVRHRNDGLTPVVPATF